MKSNKPTGMLKVRLKALKNNPYAILSYSKKKPCRSRIERAVEGKHTLRNPLPEHIRNSLEDIKYLELQKSLLDPDDDCKSKEIAQHIYHLKKQVKNERQTIKFD